MIPKLVPHETFIFLIQVLVLLGTAKLFGELARTLRQPAVLGEIIGGVLLGPTFLGLFFPQTFAWLFTASHGSGLALDGLIFIASLLLLFGVGLEIDIDSIKQQGKAVVTIGILGIIIPLIIGFGTGWLLFPLLTGIAISQNLFALFIGAALSISALPVIARVLFDLNLLKTKIGSLIIAIATLNDVVGWLLFTIVLSASGLGHQGGNIFVTIILTLVIAFLSVTWLRTIMEWVLHRVYTTFKTSGSIMAFVVVGMMGFSLLTEHIGIHAVFGAFLMGVAVNACKHVSHDLREHIQQFTNHLLAPLFFAGVGLRVNFLSSFDWKVVAVILVAAYISKMAAGMLGGKIAKLSRSHSIAVGLGITARGGMGIILATIAFDAHLADDVLFEALVIMALVTSMTSGFINKFITDKFTTNNDELKAA